MDIEKLADKAGLVADAVYEDWHSGGLDGVAKEDLSRFAALVVEECAKVCDRRKNETLAVQSGPEDELSNVMLRQVAYLGFGGAAEAVRSLIKPSSPKAQSPDEHPL